MRTVTYNRAVDKQLFRESPGPWRSANLALITLFFDLIPRNHCLSPMCLTPTQCNGTSLSLDHLSDSLLVSWGIGEKQDGCVQGGSKGGTSVAPGPPSLLLPLAPPNSLPWQAKRPPPPCLPTCLLPRILSPTCEH